MKTIFDPVIREELSSRINSLTPQHQAIWGKMNVHQMLRHCTRCDDMYLGDLKIPRAFIGRLIGPMMLRKAVKSDAPFGRNAPTSPLLVTPPDAGDMEQQKSEWLQRINSYVDRAPERFMHPFFGKMTKEEVGIFAYKHADHHLQQFGV